MSYLSNGVLFLGLFCAFGCARQSSSDPTTQSQAGNLEVASSERGVSSESGESTSSPSDASNVSKTQDQSTGGGTVGNTGTKESVGTTGGTNKSAATTGGAAGSTPPNQLVLYAIGLFNCTNGAQVSLDIYALAATIQQRELVVDLTVEANRRQLAADIIAYGHNAFYGVDLDCNDPTQSCYYKTPAKEAGLLCYYYRGGSWVAGLSSYLYLTPSLY